MRVLAIDGSPTGGGRTYTVLQAVLGSVKNEGADVTLFSLADGIDPVFEAVRGADAFVLGSPIYRASYTSELKAFLDRLPRGMWGETEAPMQGRAVAIVATGASFHHFLALNDFRNVLSGFFAAHVVPPGLYVPREGFDESATDLTPEYVDLATLQGRALVEQARALETSNVLRALKPQA